MRPNNTKHRIIAKKKFFSFFSLMLAFFALLVTSCNTTEPPPPKPEKPKVVELKEITKSCTEIFIKVTVKDTILPVSVTITRDSKEIMNFYQTKTDTTIIDTGLAAAKTYLYKAIIGNKEEGKSKGLTVSTLPTTSNNFTWKTYTFGDFKYGSSELWDVAIIDENDIWAVGEIYVDTTGQAYNAVHWNGEKWELKRIMFQTICGQSHKTPYPASSIFIFNKNEIWIAMDGDQISIIKNNNQISSMCLPFSFSIKKLWGSSIKNIYAVGDNGNIAHYNGTSWSKIESGITTNINDVWGYYDPSTGEKIVLSVVSNLYSPGEHRLLAISGNTARDTLNWPYSKHCLKSLWFKDKYSPVYIAGCGIMEYKRGKWTRKDLTGWVVKSIRGNGLNDIVAVDAEGTVLHYNGINWEKDERLKDKGYNLHSITIKGNVVVTVGGVATNGIAGGVVIAVGKR